MDTTAAIIQVMQATAAVSAQTVDSAPLDVSWPVVVVFILICVGIGYLIYRDW